MRLAGGMLSSCSRNGSMLVSKKRNMGLGPTGIAAKAGFGSDSRNAAELRRADGQRGKHDKVMKAVFAAQTSGRRVRRRSPGEPAAREALTHRRGQADGQATEPENVSNRIHSGLPGSRPTSFRGPKDPRETASDTRVDSRNQPGRVARKNSAKVLYVGDSVATRITCSSEFRVPSVFVLF